MHHAGTGAYSDQTVTLNYTHLAYLKNIFEELSGVSSLDKQPCQYYNRRQLIYWPLLNEIKWFIIIDMLISVSNLNLDQNLIIMYLYKSTLNATCHAFVSLQFIEI